MFLNTLFNNPAYFGEKLRVVFGGQIHEFKGNGFCDLPLRSPCKLCAVGLGKAVHVAKKASIYARKRSSKGPTG